MIQPLVIYPDERVNIACTDVRAFNETLENVLEDMIDTMKEHNLEALSAIQIAYPYNIIVIKNGDSYNEYINPRILTSSGKFNSTEKTLYYPNVEVTVPRYENIKLIYENRKGEAQHEDIKDRKLSATIQRKIDYLFGGNFLDKVDKKTRENILENLAKDNPISATMDSVCPTFSKKDYFVSFTDKLLFFMGISLLMPLFNISKEGLANWFTYDKFAFPAIIFLMIGFFFYAQYEAKKYRQCSSCQIGNNIGVIVKRITVAILFTVASYFILG